ncbi:uncharacterized protein K460DRAFT_367622 [Cucurbitaria berberidis CBS 394.84]|uniref:Secreted protein n=1 Tax=Cucurbitaria berberidis CBS 394.84 TaxID=1168544 RepID=A0A9P4GBB1_9PLEO|nr:uncharacterized protein K460DRAFT_367622 [Cucurbitaria berberidis CBS 394.84]KAF1842668.1 hypothetical protein K460DRAFT_367622 [Cucurbitaria berberidis CBS 394.84]
MALLLLVLMSRVFPFLMQHCEQEKIGKWSRERARPSTSARGAQQHGGRRAATGEDGTRRERQRHVCARRFGLIQAATRGY